MGWKETWHKSSPWHFAFECKCVNDKDFIFIQDAEHQDDIKENCLKDKSIITENKLHNTMNNTRNKVRLTESQLHNVIKESVKSVLREAFGDGRIEASLQRMIDTFMSPNYDGESDTCDYFYYIWEHAGNYGKVEVDGTNVCFYNQELGGLAVEVGEREIYINPEFEYSFDEKWFKQITSYCKAFQKAIINCVENA